MFSVNRRSSKFFLFCLWNVAAREFHHFIKEAVKCVHYVKIVFKHIFFHVYTLDTLFEWRSAPLSIWTSWTKREASVSFIAEAFPYYFLQLSSVIGFRLSSIHRHIINISQENRFCRHFNVNGFSLLSIAPNESKSVCLLWNSSLETDHRHCAVYCIHSTG